MRRLALLAAACLPLAGCTITIDPGARDAAVSPGPSEPLISSYCRLCDHPLVQHDTGTCQRRVMLGRKCNCPGPTGR